MKKRKFDILIPQFFNRYPRDKQESKAKKEISKLPSEFVCHFEHYGTQKIVVDYLFENDFNKISKSRLKKIAKPYDLIIHFNCTIDNELLLSIDRENPEVAFLILFDYKVIAYLIALQISLPGIVHFSEGVAISPVKIAGEFTPMISLVREMFSFNQEEFKWPKLKALDINKTWLWLEPLFNDKISTNKIQRALFGFTWIHHDSLNDLTHELFYSLLGIEALYAKGNINIMGQINEKVQIVLGELTDSKRVIKQMYDFRSRLVHGDLNIPSKMGVDYDNIKIKQFDMEIYKSTCLAIAILVATFQWMVEKNCTEITFQTKLLT